MLKGLVDGIEGVFAGSKALRDDVAIARKRSFMINAIAVVAELRLPAVIRQLRSEKRFVSALSENHLFPANLDDAACIALIIESRFPELAMNLRATDAVQILTNVVERWRNPKKYGPKWDRVVDLVQSQELWSGKRELTSEAVRVSYMDKSNMVYLGDLSAPDDRRPFFERFSAFASMMGFGSVTVDDLERALASIRAAETHVPPAVQ